MIIRRPKSSKNEAMSVLFISDLHLEAERPDITRAFLSFLDEAPVGPRPCTSSATSSKPGSATTAWTPSSAPSPESLRQVADGGTRIYLMHGNRDFLVGEAFCREAGCTLLPDPSVIDLYGEPVLLMHGDSLCTRDEAYMRLRRWLRNPLTLWVLRHLPLATWHKLAHKLRKESRAQTRMKAVGIIDDHARKSAPGHARAWRCVTLIHGHTHRPAEHTLDIDGQPARRIVLGDWDRQGWALEIDANGHRQAPSRSDSTPGPPCGPFSACIMRDSHFSAVHLPGVAGHLSAGSRSPTPHQGMIVIISKET